MKNTSFLPVLLVPGLLLLIPASAMFTKAEGWGWSTSDFVVAWVLMTGVGLTYKLITRKAVGAAYRGASALALFAALLLLWVNGAVGLIGSEDNLANLLYLGVLVTGVLGAAFARLEPSGMAKALAATALAQFLVPLVALAIWRPDFSPGVAQVLGLNFGFVLMFAVSALLYQSEARRPSRSPS